MSAPVAAEILREFSAEARQFRSVRGALLWYVNARPHLQAVNAEPSAGPSTQSRKNQKQRTLGLIAQCLVVYDAECDNDAPPRADLRHHREKHWRRRLEVLIAWYVQTTAREGEPLTLRGMQRIADELDMSPAEASRYCGQTENVIRRRMLARGLLE